MAYGETEKHIILSFSFKGRKRLPCLLSELANGPGECVAVKAKPTYSSLFLGLTPDSAPSLGVRHHFFLAAHTQWLYNPVPLSWVCLG